MYMRHLAAMIRRFHPLKMGYVALGIVKMQQDTECGEKEIPSFIDYLEEQASAANPDDTISNPRIFDPHKAFFVIDSDHLEETRTAFYGFTFLNDAVIDSLEALKGQIPEEDGAYVYLRREGNRLTITQDFIGSWGLYLYRQGDYFALSNSFLYLVEYLRDKRPLSLNKEFADYMLVADLCSAVFEETLVREITLLDRGAVVNIDISARTLEIRLVDYMENTVDPSTPEGLAILDGWRDKWVGRIRHIAATSGNIRTDAVTAEN